MSWLDQPCLLINVQSSKKIADYVIAMQKAAINSITHAMGEAGIPLSNLHDTGDVRISCEDPAKLLTLRKIMAAAHILEGEVSAVYATPRRNAKIIVDRSDSKIKKPRTKGTK